MKPHSHLEFVPRDSEESEFFDLVVFGDVAFSVETVIGVRHDNIAEFRSRHNVPFSLVYICPATDGGDVAPPEKCATYVCPTHTRARVSHMCKYMVFIYAHVHVSHVCICAQRICVSYMYLYGSNVFVCVRRMCVAYMYKYMCLTYVYVYVVLCTRICVSRMCMCATYVCIRHSSYVCVHQAQFVTYVCLA